MKKRCGLAGIVTLFFVCLIMIMTSKDVSAASTTTVSYGVTYHQSDARSMLAKINKFRKNNGKNTSDGSQNWYWKSDNTSVTQKKLNSLKYDYELEKIAMKRATEIAIAFGHGRPNGTICYSCSSKGTYTHGENICAGYSNADAAFLCWREDDKKYSGQGHRRNMLNSTYTTIGIAHVTYNGYDFWVQEFGTKKSSTSKTTAKNSKTTVSTSVKNAAVDSATVTSYSLTMKKGTKIKPSVKANIHIDYTFKYNYTFGNSTAFGTASIESFPSAKAVTVKPSASKWTSSNTKVIKVKGSYLVAVKSGTAKIKTKVFGKTVTISVTVK